MTLHKLEKLKPLTCDCGTEFVSFESWVKHVERNGGNAFDMSNAAADPTLINHPPHYTQGSIEVILAIEDWKLPYHLGNVVKYVARAPYKGEELQDLRKALWYLNRYVKLVEERTSPRQS